MAMEPGLQPADPLLRLGNFSQNLAPGIFHKQEMSLHRWREFCPSFWTNGPCFHKTLTTLFFKKLRFFHLLQKIFLS